MNEMILTKTHLRNGIWEGVLEGVTEGTPQIGVSHLDEEVPGVIVKRDVETGVWYVRVPIPIGMVADGVQTFVIRDLVSGETLNSFALLSGEALAEDIRAETELLREELDLLKRAFRRHCVETMEQ